MILEYSDREDAISFLTSLGLGNVGHTKIAVVSASKSFAQSVLDEAYGGMTEAYEDDEEYVDYEPFGPDPVGVKEFSPDVLIFLAPDEMSSHYREAMVEDVEKRRP